MRKILPVLVAAVAALTATPAAAQVVLRPAPLAVTADSLTKGAEVRVVNSGPATVVLTAWTLGAFTSREGKTVPGRTAVLPGGGLRVPARSQALLLIDADTVPWKAADPGRYQSHLAVTYTGGTAEAQIFASKPRPAATATPPTPSTVAARPLVRQITLHARRGVPGQYGDRVVVPAWQGTEVNANTFVLTSDGSTPALARIGEPGAWEEDGLRRAYPVQIRNLRGGRTYRGAVDLGADTLASRVELTVHASHHIAFLFLTVLLGVAAGLAVRRWTDLHRPVTLLRERVLRAGPVFGRSADSLGLDKPATDGLKKEFGGLQGTIYRSLEQLTRFWISNDEVQKEFGDARQQVEALEAKAAAAAALAGEMQALRTAHDAVLPLLQGVAPPPVDPGILPDQPRAVSEARATLTRPVTLESMDALRSAAAAQRAFLPRWAAVFQEARQKQAWLDRVAQGAAADGEATRLAAAQLDLDRVRWDLWDLADAAAFDARTPQTLLQNVEDTLRQVAAARAVAAKRPRVTYRDGEQATLDSTAAAAPGEPGRVWLSVPGDGPLPATPAEQLTLAERIRVARGTRDVGIALAAFAAALLTTLAKHYFGGDGFGSFADYTAVFGWAFGITAATSLVLTNLTAGLATLQRVGLPPLARR
jgi:hypothetical protein